MFYDYKYTGIQKNMSDEDMYCDSVIVVDEVEEGEISDVPRAYSPPPRIKKKLPARYSLHDNHKVVPKRKIVSPLRHSTKRKTFTISKSHKNELRKWIRQEISSKRSLSRFKPCPTSSNVPIVDRSSTTSVMGNESKKQDEPKHNTPLSQIVGDSDVEIIEVVENPKTKRKNDTQPCLSSFVEQDNSNMLSNGNESVNDMETSIGELNDSKLSLEDLLKEYEYLQKQLVILDQENKESNQEILKNTANNLTNSEILNETELLITLNAARADTSVANCKPLEDTESLEEDAELKELRLRALASRAKINPNPPVEINNVASNKENVKFSSAYSTSHFSDNYDVLDMKEDEEDYSSQIAFVSLQPSVANINIEPSAVNNNIESTVTNNSLEPTNSKKDGQFTKRPNQQPTEHHEAPKVQIISTMRTLPKLNKPPAQKLAINGNVRSVMINRKKTFVQNQVQSQSKRKIIRNNPSLPMPFAKQEPLIIMLGNESSDSSEEDSGVPDLSTQAKLRSLEHLIDSMKDETEDKNDSPSNSEVSKEPLECNNLEDKASDKDKDAHFYQYALLVRKLEIAEAMLVSENKILLMTQNRCNVKKASFVTSQVEVNRLQEQLNAAVKVREVCKQMMFEVHDRLKTIQVSVNKRTEFINDLKRDCLQLEKHMFGNSNENSSN